MPLTIIQVTESDLLNYPLKFVQKKSKSCCLIVEERVMKEGKRCLVNACLLPARNLMSRCKDVLVKVYS